MMLWRLRIRRVSCACASSREAQLGMTQVLIRDKPGSSGMTPGCDSRGAQRLTGIGRHNCGTKLLIHEIAFTWRLPGVLRPLKMGGISRECPPSWIALPPRRARPDDKQASGVSI